MKTANLSIGLQVAYDANESLNYHNLVEAYVFAIRPRGTNSSYYGYNGNHNTIGIARRLPKYMDTNGMPTWRFAWVRPATIHYDWVTYSEILRANKERQEQEEDKQRNVTAERKSRINSLPKGVIAALKIYDNQVEILARQGYIGYRLRLETLEAVVKAVQNAAPDKVMQEVEAALALLG